MRFSKLATLITLCGLLLFCLPAFAGWTTIGQPQQLIGGVPYGGGFSGGPPAGCGPPACATTDFGGGDGSLTFTSGFGPFTFSTPLSQNSVPNSWATWGSPPATESSTPNVLFTDGVSSLTITTSDIENIMGFELEPDQFQQELVTATFHDSTGDMFTVSLSPNGSAGALLFAVEDTTPGAHITSVDITDTAGDDFAIAQLRTGQSGGPPPTTPEPSSILLFGSGVLGLAGLLRRKMNL